MILPERFFLHDRLRDLDRPDVLDSGKLIALRLAIVSRLRELNGDRPLVPTGLELSLKDDER